jgi:hypothetical protein
LKTIVDLDGMTTDTPTDRATTETTSAPAEAVAAALATSSTAASHDTTVEVLHQRTVAAIARALVREAVGVLALQHGVATVLGRAVRMASIGTCQAAPPPPPPPPLLLLPLLLPPPPQNVVTVAIVNETTVGLANVTIAETATAATDRAVTVRESTIAGKPASRREQHVSMILIDICLVAAEAWTRREKRGVEVAVEEIEGGARAVGRGVAAAIDVVERSVALRVPGRRMVETRYRDFGV